uniref:Saccharopine dehydrogenase NADP binding domain-containing protein n=1 Tax=Globisporangium ultimum (strain ATCC 200006 / CBS 805.95 / DAOM BR144) TaxID=431595 RepID=K3XAR3_GLOUD
MADKQFDVVIYGATGYTGQLVARYFLTEQETAIDAPNALKWAIAGRSKDRLNQTKELLKEKVPSVSADAIDRIPILVADSDDVEAVLALVKSTKVVLTLAGPYAKYANLLVQLCAENGVHYCDLTGEMIWADMNIRKYEAVAKKSGAKIVHCCGFEAMPSDVSTFLLADFVRTKLQSEVSHISYYWIDSLGGISGGTCASLLHMMTMATRQEVKRMFDPFFYTSAEYEKGKAHLVDANKTGFRVKYDKDMKNWTTVFVGAGANSPVVLRSNYLLGDYYGKAFSYWERFCTGGFFFQNVVSFFTASLLVLSYFDFTRKYILEKIVPAPGVGPTEEELAKGFFKAEMLAYDENRKLVAKGQTTGAGDPGYLITSKMIAEMAKCLAKDEHDGAFASGGGFLTPASAGGRSLAKRLHDKNVMNFEVKKVE